MFTSRGHRQHAQKNVPGGASVTNTGNTFCITAILLSFIY